MGVLRKVRATRACMSFTCAAYQGHPGLLFVLWSLLPRVAWQPQVVGPVLGLSSSEKGCVFVSLPCNPSLLKELAGCCHGSGLPAPGLLAAQLSLSCGVPLLCLSLPLAVSTHPSGLGHTCLPAYSRLAVGAQKAFGDFLRGILEYPWFPGSYSSPGWWTGSLAPCWALCCLKGS